MAGNVCGNCANFKPKAGEKFFNCTSARQGGIAYGMQVRADTRACEAFTIPAKPAASKPAPTAETKPKPVVKPAPGATPGTAPKPGETPPGKRGEERQRPGGLCAWGRTVLFVAVVVVLALLGWGIYACTSPSGGGGPTTTPTPTGPVASPTLEYFSMGQWADTSIQRRAIVSRTIASSYETKFGQYAPPIYAPPGMIFVIVEASIIYTGSTSMTTTPGDFVLVDAQGHRYRYDTYQGVNPYPSATLSVAGMTTTGGKILYTVPFGTAGLEVHCLLHGDQPVQAIWYLP